MRSRSFSKKFLQRTQQERAQAALLLIGPAQRVVLKYMLEKTWTISCASACE
jgi:hypothetical protein